MQIHDPKGKWFRLTASYPFFDHEAGVYLQPGVATKATPTVSILSQPAIVEIPDPTGEVEPPKEAVTKAKSK